MNSTTRTSWLEKNIILQLAKKDKGFVMFSALTQEDVMRINSGKLTK